LSFKWFLFIIWVKHLIGTRGLKTLFFASCAFICITDGTYSLEKDGISTSVSFSIKKTNGWTRVNS
jgi:hypothetical protein